MAVVHDGWLLDRAANVTSEFGENGIIAAALEVLPARDRFCVEFGAADGRCRSNTWPLIHHDGYRAVLIEADATHYAALAAAHAGRPEVTCLHRTVGFEPHDGLDQVLAGTAAPRDFDLLSIDIDGNDYHVWDAVRAYRPKLVVVEFNPTVPIGVPFVQARRQGVAHGASLASLIELATRKAYALIAVTAVNALFVDARYFPTFGIADNREARLRTDLRFVMHYFIGYDGRAFLRGPRELPWFGLPVREARVQQVPRWLRAWPPDQPRWRLRALRAYRRLLSVLGR